MSNTRKLYPIALLALIISVGSLFFAATPCSVAHGQTICDVGDTETISDSLVLQNDLIVGVTPSAGNLNSILQSNGAGVAPIWSPNHIENIKVKTADTSRTNDIVEALDPHLFFNDAEIVDGASYSYRGLLLLESSVAGDFKFYLSNFVDGQCAGMTHHTSTLGALISTDTDFCGLTHETISTNAAGTVDALYFEGVFTDTRVGFGMGILWAQNVSDATPTTLYTGSWFGLTRIDNS